MQDAQAFIPRLSSGRLWAFMLACVLSMVLLQVSSMVMNAFSYATVAAIFAPAREISTAVSGLAFLSVALVAIYRPRLFSSWRIPVVAVAAVVAALPILLWAYSVSNPAGIVFGLSLLALARAWATVMVGLCLVALPSIKHAALVVAFGAIAGNFADPLLVLIPSVYFGVAVQALVVVACVVGLSYLGRDLYFAIVSSESASILEMTDPRSFLKPTNALFPCVLLMSVASGYSLTLNEVGNAPAPRSALAFVLLLLIVYAVLVRGKRQEDALFSFSVLLIEAGLLMAPLVFGHDTLLVNTLMLLGTTCFAVLLWLIFYSIGRRNLFAMLPVFGIARCLSAFGTIIGAVAGHAANDAVLADPRGATAGALVFALVFFAFLWLGFRRYSFSDTIGGIQGVSSEGLGALQLAASGGAGASRGLEEAASGGGSGRETGEAEPDGRSGGAGPSGASGGSGLNRRPVRTALGEVPGEAGIGREPGEIGVPAASEGSGASGAPGEFGTDGEMRSLVALHAARCERLAAEHGLTARELEVLILLARGRNAQYVMDEFGISRNTAKAHIKHIYTKLDVHSQQELINLTEG